jgi:2-octaprenyl-6-methoxyphenol hydroxylase
VTNTAIKARATGHIAVVGAGPVGLALALHAARSLPQTRISLFDARPLDRELSADARTLALSLGSVQFLQGLQAWPEAAAQSILEVHVSQQPPTWGRAEVRLRAADLGVPRLGAVLAYGTLMAPLQAAWLALAAQQPQRLQTRFGTPVAAIKPMPGGVEVDAGIAERFDLAVVAEGGVFAEQARKAVVADYAQTAWVGQVVLAGGTRGMAFERFTRNGPAALLPLPERSHVAGPGETAAAASLRAALVWCVPTAADPVRPLTDTQRMAVLNNIFPAAAGRVVDITPLKAFALGLNAERTLVQERTVRIGNAAQTLHPVAGQGLNLGLRDAHALVDALRADGGLDAALRRIEWSRAPDRWAMIVATDFLARSFTWQLPGAAALRGLGLAALQAVPTAKGWLARRMMFGSR